MDAQQQPSHASLVSPSFHQYERLSDIASPGPGSPRARYDLWRTEDDDEDDDYFSTRRKARSSWFQRITNFGRPPEPAVQSNYLTLIPLSDERLKPRHTKLIVSGLLLLAFALATGVFLLVPRGVTVGSIQVHSSKMSFNTSKSTYQIILTANIPIFNPNYLPVTVNGSLVVSFYDQQAGVTLLEPVEVPARAFPQVITVDMDASSVPQQYLFTIYTQCFTFPEKIIFFLTGKLQSKYLGMTLSLPDIDTYFIISCTNAPDASNPPRPARPPKAPKAPARPPLWGWREGEEGRAGVEAGVSLGAEAGAEVEAGVEVDVDGGAGQEWQGVAAGREGEVGAGGAGVGGEVAGWEEATGEAGREELERGGGQGRKGLGGRGGAAGS